MRNHKPKLPMLQPRLKELPSRIPMLKPDRRKVLTPNRTLALNGAAWAKLRALVLAEEPICRRCYEYGRITAAVDVDHIDNDAANNQRANLQALCHSCHSVKTAQDMGAPVRHGCDVNGMPLDPAHEWNKKSPATEGGAPPGTLHAQDRSCEV